MKGVVIFAEKTEKRIQEIKTKQTNNNNKKKQQPRSERNCHWHLLYVIESQ